MRHDVRIHLTHIFRIFRRQPVISKTTKNDVESIPETN
jgi:hypothetical protein